MIASKSPYLRKVQIFHTNRHPKWDESLRRRRHLKLTWHLTPATFCKVGHLLPKQLCAKVISSAGTRVCEMKVSISVRWMKYGRTLVHCRVRTDTMLKRCGYDTLLSKRHLVHLWATQWPLNVCNDHCTCLFELPDVVRRRPIHRTVWRNLRIEMNRSDKFHIPNCE